MVIDIKCSYAGAHGDTHVFIDDKIAYFATIGKKIRLLDKNDDILIKNLKKGLFGNTVVRDKKRQKALFFFKFKDKNGRLNYAIHQRFENRIFRVQIFSKDGVKYLLFTENKKIFAAAKSKTNSPSLFKIYLKEQDQALCNTLLLFVLHFIRADRKKSKTK